MILVTRLRVASNPSRGWQAKKKAHLCAASIIRAMPETEKPPAMRVDNYFRVGRKQNDKPGYVVDVHLSSLTVASKLQQPT